MKFVILLFLSIVNKDPQVLLQFLIHPLSADVFSVVAIKCAILLNLSYTTKIALYSWTKSSFIIKYAEIWLYSFSGIAFSISFSARALLLFLYHWQASHLSIYLLISLVTPGQIGRAHV